MELNKDEAALVLEALNRVDIRGLDTAHTVLAVATKLRSFISAPEAVEVNGDDVPSSPE